MSKEKIDDLIIKYEAGETSLAEEEYLFNQTEKTDGFRRLWASFCKKKQEKAPSNLQESAWNAIQIREIKKKRFRIWSISAAATILLAASIPFIRFSIVKADYSEKEALLQEALTLLDEESAEHKNKNILYEDEMIIIYTEKD